MSVVRQILWQRLNADLTKALGSQWIQKKLIIYGAGGLGLSFMQTYPQLSIECVIDGDPLRKGDLFQGLTIETSDILQTEDLNEIVVFITSSWHQEIRLTLESYGLVINKNFFFGNQQAHGRIFFYLQDMSDFQDAFAWFKENGVIYSILRWFETLPKEMPGDIDLLVRTEDLEKLFDNPYLKSEPVGIPLEVYWSSPLGQQDELLYYPTWLANQILSSRYCLESGIYAPSDDIYLKSLAYHVVFHKAERSKWPVTDNNPPIELPNKYLTKIQELSVNAAVNLEFSLNGMWSYLETIDWLPPIDLARRYAVALNSPWLKSKVGPLPKAQENVLVFVLREWLLERPEVMEKVIGEIENLGMQRILVLELSEREKTKAYAQIRGGNWVESKESREGGGPAAFAVIFDPQVAHPSNEDILLRPFCTNHKLGEKTDLKQHICNHYNNGNIVNFLHAADDEREGIEYLQCLTADRFKKVLTEIDIFRGRSRVNNSKS